MTDDGVRTSRAVALALLVGAVFTLQEVSVDLAARRPQSVGADVLNGTVVAVTWALLTPLVLAAARRWPLAAKPVARPLLAHVAVALALVPVRSVITMVLGALAFHLVSGVPFRRELTANVSRVGLTFGAFTWLIYYGVAVMVYRAWRFRNLWAHEQLSVAALESELTRSKLESLRAQLRPHFLFNTLNAISVFVTEDAAKAQQMILRLSTLLRRSLDEEAQEVPLAQELAFVNDYLDIQRARFGDRLSIEIAVDPATLDARVPVFLLQPLLENAIEHGRSEDRCTTVSLQANRDRDALRITLADDGPGLVGGRMREGIGLSNTRARLQHLYGNRATVELGAATATGAPPGARVDIRIPFVEAAR